LFYIICFNRFNVVVKVAVMVKVKTFTII
jgi:hypothetical protein